MRHIKHSGFIVIGMLSIVFLALPLFAACTPTQEERPPIKIAALIPFTGFDPIAAGYIQKGIHFKLDEIGWEVAGRKIELVEEDSAHDPVIALEKAKKVVEVDKVDVILGPLNTAACFAVGDYLKPLGMPEIIYREHPNTGSKNIFTTFGTIDGSPYPGGVYAYDKLGYRTALIVREDHVAGEDFARGFVAGFESRGGKIVQTILIPPGTIDFAPYLTSLKEADCMAFWLFPPETISLVSQKKNLAPNIPIFAMMEGTFFEPMFEVMGDSCLNAFTTAHYTWTIDTPLNKKFVDAYRNKNQEYPNTYSYGGYAATALFVEAVKATKGDTNHEAINNALAKVKVGLPNGVVSFSPDGYTIGDLYICKVVKKDGAYALDVVEKFSQMEIKVPSK